MLVSRCGYSVSTWWRNSQTNEVRSGRKLAIHNTAALSQIGKQCFSTSSELLSANWRSLKANTSGPCCANASTQLPMTSGELLLQPGSVEICDALSEGILYRQR